MNVQEFSAELDVIYENINKNGAPGLDAYEKSVILTHAQELLVKQLLVQEPDANRFPELIIVGSESTLGSGGYESSFTFKAPSGIIKILNEKVLDDKGETYTVLPISNEQLQTKLSKPYKYPPRRRAWRIGLNASDIAFVEVIARPNVNLLNYEYRYVKKPDPIVIEDIAPDSIDGISSITECNLDAGLHRDILKLASGLAEQYYYDKYGNQEQ